MPETFLFKLLNASSNLSFLLPQIVTKAPFSENLFAIAKPSPVAPPVIIIDLSLISVINSFLQPKV